MDIRKLIPESFEDFWSDSVGARERRQRSGLIHPYTCGNNRKDARHSAYQAIVGGDFGQLIAVHDGWQCPVCGWHQGMSLQILYDGDKAEDPPPVPENLPLGSGGQRVDTQPGEI